MLFDSLMKFDACLDLEKRLLLLYVNFCLHYLDRADLMINSISFYRILKLEDIGANQIYKSENTIVVKDVCTFA